MRWRNGSSSGSRRHLTARRRPVPAIVIGAVAIILTSHAVEIFAWALLYSFTQILPDVRSAIELSLGSYSTLGASGAALPARWQGLDGFEAMTGMLMFGWSTAVLAAVVQHTHTIED